MKGLRFSLLLPQPKKDGLREGLGVADNSLISGPGRGKPRRPPNTAKPSVLLGVSVGVSAVSATVGRTGTVGCTLFSVMAALTRRDCMADFMPPIAAGKMLRYLVYLSHGLFCCLSSSGESISLDKDHRCSGRLGRRLRHHHARPRMDARRARAEVTPAPIAIFDVLVSGAEPPLSLV